MGPGKRDAVACSHSLIKFCIQVLSHIQWDYRYYQDFETLFDYFTTSDTYGMTLQVQELCNLRLVSKSLCKSATHMLLRCHCLRVNPHIRGIAGLLRAKPGKDYTASITVPFGASIKHLSFPLNEFPTGNILAAQPHSPKDAAMGQFKAIIKQLPEFLMQLQELESFKVRFPTYWTLMSMNKRTVRPGAVMNLNMDMLERFINSIALGLQMPLLSLHSLCLMLPCTYHILLISQTLPDCTAKQLRHLHLGATDGTGFGAWKHDANNRAWDDTTVARYFTLSNVLKKFPNRKYESAVFDLVNRCPNLESLGIECAHYIGPHSMNWSPTSAGLKALRLETVRISAADFIRLCSPSQQNSKSNLTHLSLRFVELSDGTWKEVFSHLTYNTPNLVFLVAEKLGYYRRGASRHRRGAFFHFQTLHDVDGRPVATNKSLASSHMEDHVQFGKLQLLLAKRARNDSSDKTSKTLKFCMLRWIEYSTDVLEEAGWTKAELPWRNW